MATNQPIRQAILEAVDCLRLRKCRPDRESIAVYVMRKLGSSMNEVFSEIENIVDQGSLLKVEYKGSTSYRSPKSFDIKNSPLLTKHSKILNSSKTTRYVISAMNELLTNPIYSREGIPFEELKNKLIELDKERFTETGIKVIFEREESAGNIQAAESDDREYPVRIFPKDIKVPSDMKAISFTEDPATTSENAKKRKKPKKEVDPDAGPEEAPSPAKGKAKAAKGKIKDKQLLVYAVKSDPHKQSESPVKNEEVDDDPMRTKAELISSIGMKVIAAKAASPKKTLSEKPKTKGKKAKKTAANSIDVDSEFTLNDETLQRLPSLTLVSHEVNPAMDSKCNADPEGPALVNGRVQVDTSNKIQKSSSSVSPPKKAKIIKRKGDAQTQRKSVQPPKAKKQKLETKISDADSDEPLSVCHKPPRYTYASKKRARDDEVEDNDYDDNRETETYGSESNGHPNQCVYCKKEDSPAGIGDDFLTCGTCSAKIHPACIDYTEDQAKRLKMNSDSDKAHLQWQCFSCKRCGVCRKALMASGSCDSRKNAQGKDKVSKKAEGRYILCDQCDRGYHVKCISGTPLNESSWYCGDCDSLALKNGCTSDSPPAKKKSLLKKKTKGAFASKKARVSNSNPGKSSAPSVSITKNGDNSSLEGASPGDKATSDDSKVPDISSWTPSQVQKFFTEKGLPEEATSLREQEIDGTSLLLLRRADIIFGLNLRLGPALKIYRLVCQLQQHSSALKKKGGGGGDGASSKTTKSTV